jgi:hypothetical protein
MNMNKILTLAMTALLIGCNGTSNNNDKIAPVSVPGGTTTQLNVVDEYGDHVPVIPNGFSPKMEVKYYAIRVTDWLGYIAEINPTYDLRECRYSILYMDQDDSTFYFCTDGIDEYMINPWDYEPYQGFTNLSDFGQVNRAKLFDEGGLRVEDFVDDGRLYW